MDREMVWQLSKVTRGLLASLCLPTRRLCVYDVLKSMSLALKGNDGIVFQKSDRG